MTQTALQADLAARYQAYRATVIDALGAEAVALLDHPDLVKVGDLSDITESDARDEIVAAHTTRADPGLQGRGRPGGPRAQA